MTLKTQDYLFVGIQFVLFAAFLLPLESFLIPIPVWLTYAGIAVGIIGLIICGLAVVQLNTNLSPFPTPKKGVP